MKPGARIILSAMFFAALAVMTGGCTTTNQAARPDNPPGVAVRLPITESPDVSMKAEEAPQVLPPEPFSVGDEYRGRWLTLFEINVNPPAVQEPPGSAPISAP